MKTWIEVEKAFQDAGIKYQKKDWMLLVEIESGKFYYSPQSGKWRVKLTRVWKPSDSVEDFIVMGREYLRLEKEAKASNSQRPQNHQREDHTQELKDEVRPEFLELFDQQFKICNKEKHKPTTISRMIWKVLKEKYLLTAKEICWLSVVFNYSPGWAYRQAKERYISITYNEIRCSIEENESEWFKYFRSRWQFSTRKETDWQKQNNQGKKGDHNERGGSTPVNNSSERYQRQLNLLGLRYPFTRQELKIAYRQKALETHPDTGGTTEEFRKVNTAFSLLTELVS